MSTFANLSAKLDLNIQNFSRKLNEAAEQARKFGRNINGETNDATAAMNALNKSTTAWGLNVKSVSRVVSGILISQAFYGMVGQIKEATSAVWEFTSELEYAQIAYSNLFGDTTLANELINVLKDFAATTPFSFTESEAAAKRLLAYGIEYKNVMYVLRGVMSAAAMQGDPTKIERISRALGQIHTRGKLVTQEVVQLTEAGIPAYEILQEKLGLAKDQLGDLGREGIEASVAINALVDGITERFGTTMMASAKTLKGIISNIKDNATMLAAGIFEPFTTGLKSGLNALGQFLFKLRETFELKGVGGVFEELFPEELHSTLRQTAASLSFLAKSITSLFMQSGLLRMVFEALIRAFNALAPIVANVIAMLSGLVHVIASNQTAVKYLTAALAAAAAMWVVFKVKAVAAAVVTGVVTAISKALAGLSAMLTFVMAHPFWSLLIATAGVVVGLSGGFGKLSDSISNVFKNINRIGNVDPDKMLLPSQKERANDLEKFNERLGDTSDAMDDLADSTGKANKAAKSLLSFDEVFKLNEVDDANKGISDENLEALKEAMDLISGGYMPEIPDFTDYTNAITEGFLAPFKDAWQGVSNKISSIISTAIGSAFGSILGTAIGGALGGKIGILAGAIAGYFWDKLADAFNLTPDQKVQAGIITGVTTGLGTILGGLVGGKLGAKIGTAIGALVGSVYGMLSEKFGVVDEQHISTLLSGFFTGLTRGISNFITKAMPTVGTSIKEALKGSIKQGIVGAIVGLAVGAFSNLFAGWLADELGLVEDDLKNAGIGQTIVSILGTITGMILGGPVGALVGGALGQFAGTVIGEFWNYMTNTLRGTLIGAGAGTPLGALIGTLVGSIGGPLGAAIGAAVGAALGAIIGLIVDYWEPLSEWSRNTADAIESVFEPLTNWLTETAKGFGNWFTETITGFASWFTDTLGKLSSWWKTTKEGFITWKDDTLNRLAPWWESTKDGFNSWKEETLEKIKAWWDSTVALFSDWDSINSETLGTWWKNTKDGFNTWKDETFEKLSTWWDDTKTGLLDWADETLNKFIPWWNDTKTGFTNWASDTLTTVASWIAETAARIWNWITDTTTGFLEWRASIIDTIEQWVVNATKPITDWIENTKVAIGNWVSDVVASIDNFANDAVDVITGFVKASVLAIDGWIEDTIESIGNWAQGIYEAISEAIEDIIEKIAEFLDLDLSISDFCTGTLKTIESWASGIWDTVSSKFSSAISKVKEFLNISDSASTASTVNIPTTYSGGLSSGGRTHSGLSASFGGHATGGIFNREHIARFAENNKAEAVIPLENASAMQPFVNAISQGILEGLAPTLVQSNASSNNLPPMYIGTLVADERGLKQLYKKFELIKLQEDARRGFA